MRLPIAAMVAGALLGCGQKGPLMLPDAQHPHKKIGAGRPSASPATPAAPGTSSSPNSVPSPDKTPPAPDPAPQPKEPV